MEKGVIGILIIVLIFTLSLVLSAPIENILHLNIQVTNSSGGILTGTFNFIFSISTTADCGTVVYSDPETLTTDSNGGISYYLPNVNINYSDQYWLCYYRGGVLINSSKIAMVPYAYRAKNVSSSGIEVNSNIGIGNFNISASTGTFVSANITGNLNLGGGIISYNSSTNNYIYYNGTVWSTFGMGTGSSTNYWGSNGSNIYNATAWVGIGTANPTALLDVNGSTQTKQLTVNQNSFGDFVVNFANDTSYLRGGQIFNRARGSISSPTDTKNGDWIGQLRFQGYNGTGGAGGVYRDLADIIPVQLSDWNGAYANSSIYFYYNTPDAGGNGEIGQGFFSDGKTYIKGNTGIGIRNPNSMADKLIVNGSMRVQNSSGTLVLYVNDSTGYVGIGTTAPSYPLEIDGGTNFGVLRTKTTGSMQIRMTEKTNFNNMDLYVMNSTGDFRIANTSGNYLFTILQNGNVGIGTTNPTTKLYVNGTSADATGFGLSRFETNSGTNDVAVKIGAIAGATTSGYGWIQGVHTGIGNDANLILNPISGNVGIGTATPTQKLDVRGTINASGMIYYNNGTPVSGSSTNYWASNGSNIYNATAYVGIGTASPKAPLEINGTGDIWNILRTTTGNIGWQFISGGSSKGYVGYTGGGSNGLGFFDSSGNNINLLVTNGGNVGIGTTSPSYLLTVNGSSAILGNNSQLIINPGGALSDTNQIVINDRAFFGYIQDYTVVQGTTGKGILFNVNNSTFGSGTAMIVKSAGSVGIGTTTPSNTLDVRGTINASGMIYYNNGTPVSGSSTNYWASNGSNIYNATAYVGIGTSTPDALLTMNVSTNGTTFLHGLWGGVNDGNTGTFTVGVGETGVNPSNPRAGISFNKFVDGAFSSTNITFFTLHGGVSNAQRMIIDKDGNVGINTTTPARTLDVNGDIRVTNGVMIAPNYYFGDLTTYLTQGGTNVMVFATNATARMRIDASGNVGIGTTNPQNKVDIRGANTLPHSWGTLALSSTDAMAIDKGGQLTFGANWNSTVSDQTWYASIAGRKETGVDGEVGGYLQFATRNSGTTLNTEKMRITSAGNVGIGTVTPSNKLDVRGSGNFSGTVYINNGTDISSYLGLSPVYNSLNASYLNISNLLFVNGTNVGIGTMNPGSLLTISNPLGAELRISTFGGTDADSNLTFYENTVSRGTIQWNGNDNKFIWSSTTGDINLVPAGNVGIGTATPTQKLDVNGSAIFGTDSTETYRTRILSDGSIRMPWKSGNASSYSLGFYNSNTLYSTMFLDAGTGYFNWLTYYTNGMKMGNVNNNPFLFLTNNTERMRIDGSGNVGNGTGRPLTIQSNSTYSGIMFNDSLGDVWYLQADGGVGNRGFGVYDGIASAYKLWVEKTTGNVGIGTTAPSQTLDVRGQGNFSGTIYINNATDISTLGNLSWNESYVRGILSTNISVSQLINLTLSQTPYKTNLSNTGSNFTGTITINNGNLSIASAGSMLSLASITIPTWNAIYTGDIARNATGLYYANGSAWRLLAS
jgi:hypothetical protein